MRKLLLASCAALALSVSGGFARAHDPAPNANVSLSKDSHATTAKDSHNTENSVRGSLKDSVIGSGSLSESTTNTHTLSYATAASGGAGSSFNTASVQDNKIKFAAAGFSGNVVMAYSMGGQGILQANQNTGANSVQQNSVALTSTVGGNGGGLNGFSPSTTFNR